MRFTYVFDGYCGWCYGFAPAIAELAAEDWTSISVISGSLFPHSARAALADFPHIAFANDRISQLTGVRFGAPYEALLEEGAFVMDSDASAVGLVALKIAGGDDLQMAHAMQRAFYQDGLDLAQADTYERIARDHGLDSGTVLDALADPFTRQEAMREQAEVQSLGVTAYPTLLAHSPAGLYKIGGPVMTGERLVELAKSVPTEVETSPKGGIA